MKKIKELIWETIFFILSYTSPRMLASIHYHRSFKKWINWNTPKDLNEKIQWLKFYGDTSKWALCADKYRVREYIKACGLEHMLVKLYGKWDRVEDIDWNQLPNQFVMKTNHGSGDILICKDKSKLDISHWTSLYKKLLNKKFGNNLGEPHYNKISPCIIAEELLDCNKQQIKTSSLIDYKIWSFDGKPAFVLVCHDRTAEHCGKSIYDLEWNLRPEYLNEAIFPDRKNQTPIPCPKSFKQMLEAAAILSKGHPQLRVDFYEVDGKPYFGEMTFTAAAGLNTTYSQELLNILGDLCKIK